MSELAATPVVAAAAQPASEENLSKDLKSEQPPVEPSTNDVTSVNANDSAELKKDGTTTPAARRRKRPSEITDSSLVIATPPGIDSNRRQTRSQTRGTPAPAPAPTPAKKVAVEKPANGSAAKGRRGRPPKSSISSNDEVDNVAKDVEQTKSELNNNEKESNEEKPSDKVDGVCLSKQDEKVEPKEEEKPQPPKEEKKEEAEKMEVETNNKKEPKEEAPKPVVQESAKAVEPKSNEISPEKSPLKEVEKKPLISNSETVNNHEIVNKE